MSGIRIAGIVCIGFGVALAFSVAGVDWIDTGTGRVRMTSEPLPPRPLVFVNREEATEPLRADEPLIRDRMRKANVSNRTVRQAALAAVTALTDVSGEHAESSLAVAALSHTEAAVRDEAVHALGERGGTIALQTLQQALQDPSRRVRHTAVRSLGAVGGHNAVLALGSALSAGDASMRVNVVDALGRIGGPEATGYIEQVLGDENEMVREAAAEWLAEPSGRKSAMQ